MGQYHWCAARFHMHALASSHSTRWHPPLSPFVRLPLMIYKVYERNWRSEWEESRRPLNILIWGVVRKVCSANQVHGALGKGWKRGRSSHALRNDSHILMRIIDVLSTWWGDTMIANSIQCYTPCFTYFLMKEMFPCMESVFSDCLRCFFFFCTMLYVIPLDPRLSCVRKLLLVS